jgi:hypothetical protein
VFTGVTHTRVDEGTSTSTNTEPSVGVSGNIGGTMERGANALALQYGGTLEARHRSASGDQSDDSSIVGASRYTHADPASRLDFNLGHTVNSVRNNTGFVINPSSYDTQNTLSAGTGLRFFPGDLSTLRFSAQAGQSFGGDALDDQKSFTGAGEFSRRLSERSTGGLNVSRTWSEERSVDMTIDTAQLVYNIDLEGGHFGIGAGQSKAQTEYTNGTTVDSDAITGFIERTWVSNGWRTSVEYNRRMSDSATDLSLNVPPVFSFLPDSVRLRDLVVSDSLLVTYNNQQVCSICDVGFYSEGAILDSQISGDTTHEYRAGVNLGLQLTANQRLRFGYSWDAEAEEDAGVIVDQVHRVTASWTRQLAEYTSFGVELNQSYLDSRLARNNQDEYELRLVLSHGFSMSGQQ